MLITPMKIKFSRRGITHNKEYNIQITLDYYQKLWTQQVKDNTTERKWEQRAENCVDLLTMEELETNIKNTKT